MPIDLTALERAASREFRRWPWMRTHVERDDLVQEAALRLAKGTATLGPEGQVSRLMREVAADLADYFNAAKRSVWQTSRRPCGTDRGQTQARPRSFPMTSSLHTDAHVLLGALNAQDRTLMELRAQGYTFAEIAPQIGLRVSEAHRSAPRTAARYRRALLRLEGARVAERRKQARVHT